MDFHFIKLNYNGTYLSLVDPNSKSRFICFADTAVTNKCIDYMADFRNRNRIWPSFDMSGDQRKLKMGEDGTIPIRNTSNYKTFLGYRDI